MKLRSNLSKCKNNKNKYTQKKFISRFLSNKKFDRNSIKSFHEKFTKNLPKKFLFKISLNKKHSLTQNSTLELSLIQE